MHEREPTELTGFNKLGVLVGTATRNQLSARERWDVVIVRACKTKVQTREKAEEQLRMWGAVTIKSSDGVKW